MQALVRLKSSAETSLKRLFRQLKTLSNCLGSSCIILTLRAAAIRANLGTDRTFSWYKPKNDFSSLLLEVDSSSILRAWYEKGVSIANGVSHVPISRLYPRRTFISPVST